MPTLEIINYDALITMLKGEPGTWKSSTALTYPLPQYWFSFDRKMQSLALPARKHGIDLKQVNYDDYSTWTMHGPNNTPSALAKLESFKLNCPYKTIIIDSVTSTTDAMLRQVLDSKVGQKRKSGEPAGKIIGGIDVNEIEDFNAEAAGINELMGLCSDICTLRRVNVILIAHVVRIEQKDLSGNISISRSIVTAGKKPAAKIPAICHETYQFGLKPALVVGAQTDIQVYTTNTSEDYARTCLPLDKVLQLGPDINFYKRYIEPAINQMKGK